MALDADLTMSWPLAQFYVTSPSGPKAANDQEGPLQYCSMAWAEPTLYVELKALDATTSSARVPIIQGPFKLEGQEGPMALLRGYRTLLRRFLDLVSHFFCSTIDSKTLERGCRMIHKFLLVVLLSLAWDQGAVMFQLSGFTVHRT